MRRPLCGSLSPVCICKCVYVCVSVCVLIGVHMRPHVLVRVYVYVCLCCVPLLWKERQDKGMEERLQIPFPSPPQHTPPLGLWMVEWMDGAKLDGCLISWMVRWTVRLVNGELDTWMGRG